jgi:hypothetical protein
MPSFRESSPNPAGHPEIARLAERLRTAKEVDELFHSSNRELILALVEEAGWHVVEMVPWGEEWLRCHLRLLSLPPRSASHPLLS